MTALRVRAPAKINWTLEVLGKRPDGYHETRSIMQTIDLADGITLREADEISLSLGGEAGMLLHAPVEENLAYRAARLLRGEAKRGVQIELEKRIPIAAGLGGGSSDAAAVLRGLRRLWKLDVSDEELRSIGAGLGSDVPFFLRSGTALVSGRGEQVETLPDVAEQTLIVAWDESVKEEHKTARMYAALRPEHFSDGSRTARLAERIRRGEAVRDEDVYNVFEQVRSPEGNRVEVSPAHQGTSATSHLCGSGPAWYFMIASQSDAEFMALGLPFVLKMKGIATRTIGSREATATEELD